MYSTMTPVYLATNEITGFPCTILLLYEGKVSSKGCIHSALPLLTSRGGGLGMLLILTPGQVKLLLICEMNMFLKSMTRRS